MKVNLKIPIFMLALLVSMGTLGFHIIEGETILKSLYWTVVTITTVGYGDVTPNTELGRVFAMALMVTGIGVIFYILTGVGKNIIEGRIWEIFTMSEKEKEIKNVKDHLIICGYEDIGATITEELLLGNESVVIIDQDGKLLREKASGLPYVVGDPTKEEDLEKAKIDKAKGLFATL
ncbi:hypothetical protein AKJ45_03485, partial [candidate division MSBL1 archaeon SCGC-AAA261F19]